MFDALEMAPPDPILGLTEAFKKDPNPKKINLSVGIYKDAAGRTPVLATVKEAEERLLAAETSKTYLSIEGAPEYGDAVQALLFGAGHEVLASRRAATAHTPGGTGALRVAGDFLRARAPKAAVWMPDPTWPNHAGIFQAAGLAVKTYPYYDAAAHAVKADALLDALRGVPAGDAVLLHGCCHNPTGADLTLAQWRDIAGIVADRGLVALVDFAYQGFADGLEEDAAGLRALVRPGVEALVASSFSKNFGLYNERVGALTVVASGEAAAQAAMSHVKLAVRANYSNPPAHGGAIVRTILEDAALRPRWEAEVKDMRERINGMRRLFVETLAARVVQRDFRFLTRQRGMFSFSGLTPQQVDRLRTEHAVYVVRSGRINVAGLTESNMTAVCDAIRAVLHDRG